MIKAAFDSLSRRVDQAIRQGWGRWGGPRRYAGSCIEHTMTALSDHPFIYVGVLLALKVTTAVLWCRSGLHTFLSKEWDAVQLSSYFGTLWSVQATITALVYPIVISFVAVLLQRRATAKLSLRLYLRDAVVLPAGIGSLVLLALLGAEYLALPYVERSWIAMAVAGDTVWFCVNAILTGAFLYRTIRYVDDSVRLAVFARYAIADALVNDVRERLVGLIFQQDQPKIVHEEGDDAGQSLPRVVYFPMGDGEPAVSLKVRSTREIVDVHLRLLRCATRLWQRAQISAESTQRTADAQAGGALLTIEFAPGETLVGTKTLCAVRGSTIPGPVATFLIRYSVVTGRRKSKLSTVEFFEELASEILTLLEQRRYEAATDMLSGLADLHAELIRAGNCVAAGSERDNAALLPDPYGFGSLKLHQEWQRAYRDLILTAGTDQHLNTPYYVRCCHLTYQILNRIGSEHIDIRAYMLNFSTLMAYGLGKWWSEKADEHGLVPRNSQRGVVLPVPHVGRHELALNTFIEAWECLPEERRQPGGKSVDEVWEAHADYLRFSAEYLQSTLKMVAEAVVRGDSIASRWLLDSCLKWWDRQESGMSQYPECEDEFALHTVACMDDDWQAVRSTVENLPGGDEACRIATSLASVVLKRFWIDARIVAALTLLGWADDIDDDSSLRLELVISLLAGRNYREGGHIAPAGLQQFRTLLLYLIRAQASDSRYLSRLDGIVRNMEYAREPMHPGGRVYTPVGSSGMRDLLGTQVELLVAVAGTHQGFQTLDIRKTLPLWVGDIRRLDRLEGVVRSLKDGLSNPASTSRARLIGRLRDAVRSGAELDVAVAAAKSEIEELGNAIARARENLINKAHVAPERVQLVAEAVSQHIVERKSRYFPLSVAHTYTPVASLGAEGRLNISNVRKGAFTEPPLEESFGRMTNWYNEPVAEQICAVVLGKYLQAAELSALPSMDADSFDDTVRERAQAIRERGRNPVLAVPTHQTGALMSKFRRAPEAGSRALSFTSRHGMDARSVIGYLDEIAIHVCVSWDDSIYIVPLEDFRELEYGALEAGQLVSVGWSPESDQSIVLHFTWDVCANAGG
jgi:hypothetical protein